MNPWSDKTKQFLTVLLKILIVSGAFYVIYHKLNSDPQLSWNSFRESLQKLAHPATIFLLFTLTFGNRFLEIIKWQNLGSTLRPLSLIESTKQVLAALTAGIFTPNGIGEYAGKAFYFEKKEAGQVVFLNLICNGIQMVLTIVLGTIGLFILGYTYWGIGVITLAFVMALLFYFTQKITIKGYSFHLLYTKIQALPKSVHQKNNLLALGRYLIFSHQYYFLFRAFEVHLSYATLMGAIAAVYFLASSLPSFQFLDFAVKGSVALFFFGKLGVNDWTVVFISTLMWLMNVVVPVLLGSYFILIFKPQWKSSSASE
ncbi:MAG: hypothetical protein RLZZ500_2021 [Bacteroidota bacterium]|jgi:hypothetical protein